jgi:subfamily B ATP-binding cassette protein MsbA
MVIIQPFIQKTFNYLFAPHNAPNGVLRDLRKSMYKKIVELPISYYSEKKGRYYGAYAWRQMKFKTLFFSSKLVVKDLTIVFALVTMFIISTKLSLFVLILCLFPMDHFKSC